MNTGDIPITDSTSKLPVPKRLLKESAILSTTKPGDTADTMEKNGEPVSLKEIQHALTENGSTDAIESKSSGDQHIKSTIDVNKEKSTKHEPDHHKFHAIAIPSPTGKSTVQERDLTQKQNKKSYSPVRNVEDMCQRKTPAIDITAVSIEIESPAVPKDTSPQLSVKDDNVNTVPLLHAKQHKSPQKSLGLKIATHIGAQGKPTLALATVPKIAANNPGSHWKIRNFWFATMLAFTLGYLLDKATSANAPPVPLQHNNMVPFAPLRFTFDTPLNFPLVSISAATDHKITIGAQDNVFARLKRKSGDAKVRLQYKGKGVFSGVIGTGTPFGQCEVMILEAWHEPSFAQIRDSPMIIDPCFALDNAVKPETKANTKTSKIPWPMFTSESLQEFTTASKEWVVGAGEKAFQVVKSVPRDTNIKDSLKSTVAWLKDVGSNAAKLSQEHKLGETVKEASANAAQWATKLGAKGAKAAQDIRMPDMDKLKKTTTAKMKGFWNSARVAMGAKKEEKKEDIWSSVKSIFKEDVEQHKEKTT